MAEVIQLNAHLVSDDVMHADYSAMYNQYQEMEKNPLCQIRVTAQDKQVMYFHRGNSPWYVQNTMEKHIVCHRGRPFPPPPPKATA